MKNRVLWKMFLLEIVTFGIYRLYFLIKTRNEMVRLNPNIKIKSPWFLLVPIIVIIAAFLVMMGSFIAAAKNSTNCPGNTGFSASTNASTQSSLYGANSSSFDSTTPNNANYTNTSNLDSPGCDPQKAASIAGLAGGLVFYVALFAAFIMYVIWLWGYCHATEVITQSKLSFAVSLIIMVLVPDGIDILILQDYFNKVGATAHSDTPAQPQAFQPPPPVTPVGPAPLTPA